MATIGNMYKEKIVKSLTLRNGGEDRWVELSKPFYHEELGVQLSGFGIYQDDDINKSFCDIKKIENLRDRTVDPNASKVVIPVIGTDERNNNYHLAMKTALQNHIIRFPVDEITAKDALMEDGTYSTLDPHTRMRTLLGHVQLDIMIIDEAIKLQQVIKKGFVALEVAGRNKRDRIVACEYANYFYALKELEMLHNAEKKDWDMSDWRLWG